MNQAKSAEALLKRVAVLERKIEREKKARYLAEQQLEKYSLDIYETNQSLQASLAFAKKKQGELEYLAHASSDVASEIPLRDMIINTVELTGKFCSADYGFYFITENGLPLSGQKDETWCPDLGWQATPELNTLVKNYLPFSTPDIFESWLVTEVSAGEIENCNWLIYVNFALSGNKVGWLALLTHSNLLDEEMLYTLETARGHILSGIRRRLTDVRILQRNVQLQDSVNNLEQAKRQLIQSEKMASLGQLAAGVAHEINNPIGYVRSNTEILKDYIADFIQLIQGIKQQISSTSSVSAAQFKILCQKMDLPYLEEDSAELVSSNIEGLDRVKEIVDNLKSFSHSGDQILSRVSLKECVEGSLKIAWNSFKYEHFVDNQLDESELNIKGNKGQLQQVLVNLFVNAAYAMEDGGILTISATVESKNITLHISDNGCGMDEQTVSQLFTPFFTTKPVGVGTGLGLSVSYAILEAHNAQVTVNSKKDKGTTFNLKFPLDET